MNAAFVRPNWHEFDAYLKFDGYDLQPYYAVYRAVQTLGGGGETHVTVGADRFRVSLTYEDSGIGALRHPSCDLKTIREFRIYFEYAPDDPDTDDVGERSGSFHIAPQHDGMVDTSGDEIDVPPGFTGLQIRPQGSNLHPDRYLDVLRAAWRAFGLDERYINNQALRADLSNIVDAAAELRIHHDHSGPLHAQDGPINRIAHLLAGDREGYRKLVMDHRERAGGYVTATIGSDRAGTLLRGHQHAKEIKHYYVQHPEEFDTDDPLAHPKLAVSYQASKDDHTVRWSDRDQLFRELEAVALNVCDWAGLPVTAEALQADLDDHAPPGDREPGTRVGPYVVDPYFRAGFDRRQRRLVDDPTPAIEDRQDSLVVRTLTDGLADSDFETLEKLVSDGGYVAPQDIAEDTGRHLDTIYRALDRLDDIVCHEYGAVQLRSQRIAEQVLEAVRTARDVAGRKLEDAAREAQRILEDSLQESIDRGADALTQWLDHHGIDVESRENGQLVLRFGRFDGDKHDLQDALLVGRARWKLAGLTPRRFKNAELDVYVTELGSYYRATAGGLLQQTLTPSASGAR